MLPVDQLYINFQKWCEKQQSDKSIVCEAAEPQKTFHFIGNASVTPGTASQVGTSTVAINTTLVRG